MLSPVKLCLLFGRIAGVLLALAILWLFIAPGYNKVVVPISKIMSPGSVELTAKAADIHVEYSGFLVSPPRGMDIHGYMLHWVLLLSVAIFLGAMPMKYLRRLLWLPPVIASVIVLNAFTVAALAWALHWTHRGGPFSIFTIGPWMPLIYTAFPALIAGASLAIALRAKPSYPRQALPGYNQPAHRG